MKIEGRKRTEKEGTKKEKEMKGILLLYLNLTHDP